MRFQIENQPVFTSLTVQLDSGETIQAEAGAMIAMTSTVELKSKTSGQGFGGIFKAAMGGEGLFKSEYTASGGPGEVTFAPAIPGDILAIELSGRTILAQSGAWLAGTPDVQMSAQGSLKAMVSGEGLFLQKLSGNGRVFLSSYGAMVEKNLKAGETWIIDTGNMVAFEASVSQKIRKAAKGLFSTLASGEGLVAEFTGPGKVWMQTRCLPGLAQALARFLPAK